MECATVTTDNISFRVVFALVRRTRLDGDCKMLDSIFRRRVPPILNYLF